MARPFCKINAKPFSEALVPSCPPMSALLAGSLGMALIIFSSHRWPRTSAALGLLIRRLAEVRCRARDVFLLRPVPVKD